MKINYQFLQISFLVATIFAVTGCGETKLLGGQVAPDELEVVDAPPLSLPPNFELRPPKEGEIMLVAPENNIARDLILGNVPAQKTPQSVQKLQIKQQVMPQAISPKTVEKAVFPQTVENSQEYKPTKQPQPKPQVDSWLVKKAGGEVRDENIRQEVQKDFEIEQAESEQGFFAKKFGKKARDERARQRALETQQKYEEMLQTK